MAAAACPQRPLAGPSRRKGEHDTMNQVLNLWKKAKAHREAGDVTKQRQTEAEMTKLARQYLESHHKEAP